MINLFEHNPLICEFSEYNLFTLQGLKITNLQKG